MIAGETFLSSAVGMDPVDIRETVPLCVIVINPLTIVGPIHSPAIGRESSDAHDLIVKR